MAAWRQKKKKKKPLKLNALTRKSHQFLKTNDNWKHDHTKKIMGCSKISSKRKVLKNAGLP